MAKTHHAPAFLAGVIFILVGWILFVPLGGRAADANYRSDEDLYTLLGLGGGVLILAGTVMIIASIFRALRRVDNISDVGVPAKAEDRKRPTA